MMIFDGWKILETDGQRVCYRNYLDNLHASGTEFGMNYLEASEKLITSPKHLGEASLIQQLEKKHWTSVYLFRIVQNIQDKKYVVKGNIEGQRRNVTNYRLEKDKKIVSIEKEECLNSEKSKLQITPLGKQVCEFCYQHFESIFNFDFTNSMESGLDNIESREISNCELLRTYISNVEELILRQRQTIKIILNKSKRSAIHLSIVDK